MSMEMELTVKTRIYPTEEQESLLSKSVSSYAAACNYVSDIVFRTHELSRFDLIKETYRDVRADFGLLAQQAQSVSRTVIASYKTILQNQKQWIQPHYSSSFVELVYGKDFSFPATKPGLVSISTSCGRLAMPYDATNLNRYSDRKPEYCGSKLKRIKDKWYILIVVSFEVDVESADNVRNVVGVDRGINFVAATYDSRGKSKFYHGRSAKAIRARYNSVRAELQTKGTPSSRRRLKRIGQRENRWMRDVNHCVSKALVRDNPAGTMFVLEDLEGISKGKTMRKRDRKGRSQLVSWSFYELGQMLAYKAQLAGDLVLEVPAEYTSQACPKCGHTEKSNRNKPKHSFECKNCRYRSNDDRIGAMNLFQMGVGYLASTEEPKGHTLLVGAESTAPRAASAAPGCDATPDTSKAGTAKVGGSGKEPSTTGQSQTRHFNAE